MSPHREVKPTTKAATRGPAGKAPAGKAPIKPKTQQREVRPPPPVQPVQPGRRPQQAAKQAPPTEDDEDEEDDSSDSSSSSGDSDSDDQPYWDRDVDDHDHADFPHEDDHHPHKTEAHSDKFYRKQRAHRRFDTLYMRRTLLTEFTEPLRNVGKRPLCAGLKRDGRAISATEIARLLQTPNTANQVGIVDLRGSDLEHGLLGSLSFPIALGVRDDPQRSAKPPLTEPEWDAELARTSSPFRQLLTKSILIFYGEQAADRTSLVADIYYRHVARVYDQVVVILEGGMDAIDELDETVHESILMERH